MNIQMLHSWKLPIAFLSLAFIASCGNKQPQQQQQAPSAIPVSVDTVQRVMAAYYDEYPATTAALEEIDLRAQVSGYVTGIFFRDGAKVKKGQDLYSIDAQVYNANMQQALANLQVQETNLEKAARDAERYHELDKQDAIAKQQVDYADAALAAAKKQVAAAKAAVNSLRANVQFTRIKAPFSGTIGISQVKIGTSVVAGQTVLNTISSDDPIAADVSLDQKAIYHFMQLKQQANAQKDSLFTLAFGEDVYPYPGRISLLDRAVNPQTGTIKMRLVFPNGKGMLKPGMNGTLRVKHRADEPVPMIPANSITEQLGSFFVYVVGDSSKVTQRTVVPGRQLGSNIIIKDGLTGGERIVVKGMQNLREGSVITEQQ